MTAPYQLLAANRSVKGLRSAPKPFRSVGPGFLPDFGKHRPTPPAPPKLTPTAVHATPSHTSSASQDDLPFFAQPTSETDAPAAGAASPAASRELLAPGSPREASARQKPAALVSPVHGLLLLRSWGSRRQPESVGGVVQGELSLAKVKVVRNDLADADLEVVRSAQPAVNLAGARKTRLGSLRLVAPGWRRWLGRWLPLRAGTP